MALSESEVAAGRHVPVSRTVTVTASESTDASMVMTGSAGAIRCSAAFAAASDTATRMSKTSFSPTPWAVRRS